MHIILTIRSVIATFPGDGWTPCLRVQVRCSTSPSAGAALVPERSADGHTPCTRKGRERGVPREDGCTRRGGEGGMSDGSHGTTRSERTCSPGSVARVSVLLGLGALLLPWSPAGAGVPTDQLKVSVDQVIRIIEDPD